MCVCVCMCVHVVCICMCMCLCVCNYVPHRKGPVSNDVRNIHWCSGFLVLDIAQILTGISFVTVCKFYLTSPSKKKFRPKPNWKENGTYCLVSCSDKRIDIYSIYDIYRSRPKPTCSEKIQKITRLPFSKWLGFESGPWHWLEEDLLVLIKHSSIASTSLFYWRTLWNLFCLKASNSCQCEFHQVEQLVHFPFPCRFFLS